MKNGKDVTQQVVVGLRGDSRTQIISGVSAGDQLVITIALPSLSSTSTSGSYREPGRWAEAALGGGGLGGLGGGGVRRRRRRRRSSAARRRRLMAGESRLPRRPAVARAQRVLEAPA